MLYDESSALFVLGSLCNDTSLLDEKHPLTKYDFRCKEFDKVIFVVIKTYKEHGAKSLSAEDFVEFLKSYPTQEQIFEDNDGINFINTIKEMNKEETYDIYYEIVRKFSLLSMYKERHFDISKFYDETIDTAKALEEFNKYTLDDIINYYEGQIAEIKKEFHIKNNVEEYVAGTDFAEMKEMFKTEPLLGASFQSPYMNSVFRGMYGFLLRGAKSGGGKTATSIGDICKVTCTEYYDETLKKFVKNKSRVGASLFINTEMDLRTELDPMIIAWISGVSRSHILDGIYEGNEEERVDYANKVLLESKLYTVDDPEFTTKSLIENISDYVLNKGVKNVCFDYVQNNGFVAKEISSETKVPQREDMVLLTLTDRLKQIQRKYGIGLISSVQTNGNEDNYTYPNESCLAGGKSQVRKTDGTYIMLEPTSKELEQTKPICEKALSGKFGIEAPNNVVHIIKGRGSKYPKHIKIFQYIDLGTCRTYDLYCTDKNNCPINVEKLIIEEGDLEDC